MWNPAHDRNKVKEDGQKERTKGHNCSKVPMNGRPTGDEIRNAPRCAGQTGAPRGVDQKKIGTLVRSKDGGQGIARQRTHATGRLYNQIFTSIKGDERVFGGSVYVNDK